MSGKEWPTVIYCTLKACKQQINSLCSQKPSGDFKVSLIPCQRLLLVCLKVVRTDMHSSYVQLTAHNIYLICLNCTQPEGYML